MSTDVASQIQIIVDVTVPDDWSGREQLADAIEEFVASYVGDADRPLPPQAVTAWWRKEPILA